ncbi:MAG: hypothetical protein RLO51_13740 [Thalassobaculum sp.]|uniref:hypothetical protein n=1 Tax=Thalassobaculum sp. TaxID=2022740 RepID=UPI0032EAA029
MRSASRPRSGYAAGLAGSGLRSRLRGRPLASVVPIGIGHNNGPPMATRWGLHVWKRAHAKAWENPAPEVVQMRLRRAAELGLSYRQIASIVMECGRAPAAIVFTLDALAAPGAAERLRALVKPKLLAVGFDPDGSAEARLCALRDAGGVRLAGWRTVGNRMALASGLHDLLTENGVAPQATLLVGAVEADRALATRARLAAFLRADAYFSPQPTTGTDR